MKNTTTFWQLLRIRRLTFSFNLSFAVVWQERQLIYYLKTASFHLKRKINLEKKISCDLGLLTSQCISWTAHGYSVVYCMSLIIQTPLISWIWLIGHLHISGFGNTGGLSSIIVPGPSHHGFFFPTKGHIPYWTDYNHSQITGTVKILSNFENGGDMTAYSPLFFQFVGIYMRELKDAVDTSGVAKPSRVGKPPLGDQIEEWNEE